MAHHPHPIQTARRFPTNLAASPARRPAGNNRPAALMMNGTRLGTLRGLLGHSILWLLMLVFYRHGGLYIIQAAISKCVD